MDRRGVAGQGGGNDVGNVEVAFAAGRFADAHGFIGHLHMESVAIDGGINSDSRDAHFFTSAEDTEGDLTPIRDQNFRKFHVLYNVSQYKSRSQSQAARRSLHISGVAASRVSENRKKFF
jgi:hypothetical protein